LRELAALRSAIISLAGPVAPDVMEGVDPSRLAVDTLPRIPEANEIINARTTNWTVAPCPNREWAELVHPDAAPEDALARLWNEVAHVCRLDEDDAVAAWQHRMSELTEVAGKLDELAPDSLRFEGPGTDLTVGLFRSSRWISGRIATVDGIVHAPNLPTEEVFTTPDPERVDGVVTATKPLFVSGATVTGLRVRFERGQALEIDADRGGQTLRELSARDPGAARLGEVALVDGASRIGGLGTVFFETLLDENAASHIALGAALALGVGDEEDRPRANRSQLHIDFMIGGDDVSVTAVTADAREVPLLWGGRWQI
jgi:aminopeptidase